MDKPDYKFKEDKVLEEIRKYIDFTYTQHYGQGRIQATEFIFDTDHGEGFCVGNILKYAQRYGKKDGKNPADLFKVIHYAVMLLGMEEVEKEREIREYHDQLRVGDTE